MHGLGPRAAFWLKRGWRDRRHPLSLLLLPLGLLVCAVASLRRLAYMRGWLARTHVGVPTIVVGNLTAGGGGKSPLVAALVAELQARGRRPGILCRGYGGAAVSEPVRVMPDAAPADVGDEAVMLARACAVPVAACPDRVRAGRMLVEQAQVDTLISDDGLQRYSLQRDAEIVVLDGGFGLGNRRCLPAGPLRESAARMAHADLVLTKNPKQDAPGYALVPASLRRLGDRAAQAPDALAPAAVAAVAGIAHPDSFFETLARLGYQVQPHPFPDHHLFDADDLASLAGQTIITTAKDAVRLRPEWHPDVWVLDVEVSFNAAGQDAVKTLFDRLGF